MSEVNLIDDVRPDFIQQAAARLEGKGAGYDDMDDPLKHHLVDTSGISRSEVTAESYAAECEDLRRRYAASAANGSHVD
ncbi:MAG: hypothetical protein AAB373_01460 [Patescibacteria group bacterium]